MKEDTRDKSLVALGLLQHYINTAHDEPGLITFASSNRRPSTRNSHDATADSSSPSAASGFAESDKFQSMSSVS